ncbi:tyrosine-type recombinase/integrase [Azospirillum brasilense]|uniref:tyrosine-type recombinase/integrase n=1 Tax=Azospirillum brasilense TaxID=192 RepID=UPI00190A2D3F|nr:site-specific integrase [Azospirillum brasilense]MBK3732288.1 tyrosine-type recombinase/integrase [Azospirillum brasilense]
MPVRVQAAVELADNDPEELKEAALPVGFPFLVIEQTEQIVEPALLFMAEKYLASNRIFVANTAKAVAEDLRDWWAFLTEFDKQWDAVDTKDVELYRDAMLTTISPYTHEPYDDETVARRVGTVLRFYKWAHDKGLVSEEVDRKTKRRGTVALDRRAMAHLQVDAGRGESSDLSPRSNSSPDADVRVFLPAQMASVMSALGPLPSELSEDDPRSSRGRLVAEVCLNLGMRIDEARALTIYQIQGLILDPAEPLLCVPLRITETKGGKSRTVPMPTWLAIELLAYIDGERRVAVKRTKSARTGRRRAHDHNGLFVNGFDAGADVGRHTSKRALQDEFEKAVRAAGLVVNVWKTDPETGEDYARPMPRFSCHDLRHTFAVWTYYARRQDGDSEPWLYIQGVLGHASVATTMDTYLRVVKEFEARISDRVVSAFQRLRNGGPC